MVERAHDPNAEMITVKLPRRGSSLGIASLVLGVVAFSISWIPFVGALGVPLSGVGLLLGLTGIVVALVRRGSGIGFPIAGMVACGLALFIAIGVTRGLLSGIEKAREAERERSATVQEVVSQEERQGDATTDETQEQWASAETPLKQGDVQVRIVSAAVEKVRLRDFLSREHQQSKDTLLCMTLEVTNISETRKLDYRTWAGGEFSYDRDYASITDNFGNSYKLITFGSTTEPVGRTDRESIYPGKSLTDVLVFEPPVDRAEYLNLELPAKNFGGKGMLRIRIPTHMIH